ncbi:autotransporter outer membrane beta-barrel domain-containing protein [Novosphingobium profundi]|uniref:autotransporter outer membrane beta-barrel domain-containing protein n=1 Tax=Novosphingobium profundi TaxID=1774954 RepID=UPI001BDA8B3C|nr:autotransporter domain-containing protein [Novosphingobium profundi]MBT0668395.1 autotransporter outer membrane beta-barrel domain-containing protein [Novosphingobium profundi]
MSRLHDSASLGALILALGTAQAHAATTVKTDTTSALSTSSAGDITMTDDGSITVKSGSAITVDSDNALDIDGDIDMSNASKADGATGITVNAGTTSDIYLDEDADISIEEDFTADDEDEDGIVENGIASASNRYGIYVNGDAAGSITNEGSIYVEGQDSGGIVLAGDYTGDITNTGSIEVVGDNAVGISTQGIDGDLTVEGSVYVVGENATALAVNGDVTGTITLQGTISQLYYYTNDDGDTISLSREALRQGAAAVSITGNVDGGIYVAAAPDDDDNDDADNDGVDDDEEGTASIISYGNGPAIQVGGTDDITIGAADAYMGTYSIAIEGTVEGNSYYSNTDAYGFVIGGQGGNVTLTDGIGVSGTLEAVTYDSAATALLINEGSSVTSLYNSGTILATISSTGEGSATAIQDLSGTLTSITNTGFITASGSSTDSTVALDLSANTTGVTITQYLNDDDAETSAEYLEDNDDVDVDPTVYTKITGDILLGSGNDTIDASSGEIEGDTYFSDGDDTLTLSGDLNYIGDVYWGAGSATATMSDTSTFDGTMDFNDEAGTLTINDSAVYTGDFANADNATVTVNGGELIASAYKGGTVSIGNLYVGSSGTIGVAIDDDYVSTLYATNATLEDGASVTATITDLSTAEGTYTVLTSDNLDVEGTLNVADDLPFIYNGTVSTDDSSVYLDVSRKSTSELGLTSSSASAWDAIYAAAENDDYVGESLLEVDDSATLNEQTSTMLPDHAGGIFESVTTGTRLVSQHITDDTSTFSISDVGGWFEPIYWRSSKDATGTASYKINGWGLSLGVERKTSLGYFGLSYSYLHSTVKDNGGSQDLGVGQHDFGVFWRKKAGGLLTYARLGASKISVDSTRTYTGTIDDDDFTYDATADWGGWLFSGMVGASYRYQVSRRFSLKPRVDLEQFWLKEDGYEEDADSDAIALTVASRTSKSTTVTPMLAAAYSLGEISPDWRPLTFQLEAGRREVLSGSLGKTTAYFNGGDTYDAGEAFTIDPDSIKGAWISEISMLAGGYDFTWKITARVEQTNDSTDLSARAGLSVAF